MLEMKTKQTHFSQYHYIHATGDCPDDALGSWEHSLPGPVHSYESHRQVWEWRLSEHFFQRVQQMRQRIKAMSHTSEEQHKEGKLMILSCAWPLPNTSLPWHLILSWKRVVSVSIMEIELWIVWFLPGAVICSRLLKNPSGQLSRVGNLSNKRISEEIWTAFRLAYFSNNNFQFLREY